jgi:hypothetical protein
VHAQILGGGTTLSSAVIFDPLGKLVYKETRTFAKGNNMLVLQDISPSVSGNYLVQVSIGTTMMHTRCMILK